MDAAPIEMSAGFDALDPRGSELDPAGPRRTAGADGTVVQAELTPSRSSTRRTAGRASIRSLWAV